jgi:hypothetical protein
MRHGAIDYKKKFNFFILIGGLAMHKKGSRCADQCLVILIVAGLSLANFAWANAGTATSDAILLNKNTGPMSFDQRLQYVIKMLGERPDLYSEKYRQPIIKGQIQMGMSPHEARLAGGAFVFTVRADPSRWPANADSYNVMAAQSASPDDSEITMIFRNKTQYADEGEQSFRVIFRKGRVFEIEKIQKQTTR